MNEDAAKTRQSYGRIIGRRGFTERFYEMLTASRPEIARRLDHMDIKQQHQKLSNAISMCIMFPQQATPPHNALSRIRTSHDRHHMQIKPEYYIHWLNSLLATIAEFGPQFDDELEDCWRRTIQPSIDHIKSGY